MALTIKDLESVIAELKQNGYPGPLYIETGRYKPYRIATIEAAKRRGYRVERVSKSAFKVYQKD